MKTHLKFILGLSLLVNYHSCNADKTYKTIAQTSTTTETAEVNKPSIRVAILLDTSNSMDGLIDQAKAQLWKIVNELSFAKCKTESPNLQIALYEYGNSGLNKEEGYIRQVIGFSEDLDDISKKLFSLTTNGGMEYCGHVIQTSLNQLNWGKNPDDLKMIFIAGNESFTQGKINYTDATTTANEKNVTVNTIFCGDYNEGISSYWKAGADITQGDYMAINQNRTTVHIPSPYDDAILILNNRLNKTYIHYGAMGQEKLALQAEQDSKAQSYGKANAVVRAISKSSHLYKNSSWDLLDALEMKELTIDAIPESELPTELKGMSKKVLKTYIAKTQQERNAITQEIKALYKKRREFIAKTQKENPNGLENVMINAIKKQAKKKNYKWE
ncbi:MAG: VWA domain-containing protein [Flavobacteriaceae bacterium]|nr:VWA domain-containing protein [Flavobacteriaceae bacterium]